MGTLSFALLMACHLGAAAPDDILRYGLIVGANHGSAGESPLQYADTDAAQMAGVLTSLGGFHRDDLTLLRDPTADQVRAAFAQIHARMQREQADGVTSLFFVYYSGHADAVALHLGGTLLLWDELLDNTKKAQAQTRLLVVDACRSGTATRVKGTQLDEPFAIRSGGSDMPQGFAVVTSATADESAQESPSVRGSFFTHYFISALRGAGDMNADGRVSLTEAYQYSADQTAASTASTLPGVQHATYRYRLHGRSDLTLTAPGMGKNLSALRVSAPGEYYFHSGGAAGPLALEANVNQGKRAFWLTPGHYFVQRRTTAAIYEGQVDVPAEHAVNLHESQLQPVEYATVSLKGGSSGTASETPRLQTSLWGGSGGALLPHFATPWTGALVVTTPFNAWLLGDMRLGLSGSTAQNATLKTQMLDTSLALGPRFVVADTEHLAFSLGARVGLLYLTQSYGGVDSMPGRHQVAPLADAVVRLDILLPEGFFIGLEGALRVSTPRIVDDAGVSKTGVVPQPLAALGVGASW